MQRKIGSRNWPAGNNKGEQAMKMSYAHYTNFGVSRPPLCADDEGFIPYRESVMQRMAYGAKTPEATDGEKWIAQQQHRIACWWDARIMHRMQQHEPRGNDHE